MKAHQVNLSTIMLVEKENNTWILQVRAPLTAFQQEIKTHYADTAYQTPEEFKEMVLAHLLKNLSIVFNGNHSLLLKKGFVKLGHETNVVFEVAEIPENIENLEVKNTSFQDIYKSQSALVILKKGFTKKSFVLDEKNNHSIKIKTLHNSFVIFNDTKSNKNIIYFLIGLSFITIVALAIKRKQKLALN